MRASAGKCEEVFVAARCGEHVVIYDDIEEEFAVGIIGDDGILRTWSLYGELRWALAAFRARAKPGDPHSHPS